MLLHGSFNFWSIGQYLLRTLPLLWLHHSSACLSVNLRLLHSNNELINNERNGIKGKKDQIKVNKKITTEHNYNRRLFSSLRANVKQPKSGIFQWEKQNFDF
jgi:hypothetical protein